MSLKKKILLTGGRTAFTLDLARRFKQFGHEIYVAESVKYHLCRHSVAVKKSFLVPSPAQHKHEYINALASLIQTHNIDLLIPTFEETFYISSELSKLKQLTNIFVDNIEKLDLLHNKFKFNVMIKDTMISTPDTMLITSIHEYNEFVKDKKITYPHVLKPAYSRGSFQIKFIFEPEEIKLDISEKKPWVAQAFISGEQICTYSICHKGDVLANVFYQNNYSAGEKGIGICFKRIENPVLLEWITQFVKSIKYTGQIAFDIIKTEDGSLWPIECNPRCTSGIHLFPKEQNLPNAFILGDKMNNHLTMKFSPIVTLAMLVYAAPHLKSLKKCMSWFKCLLKGKDVVFRWSDPLPFFTQFLLLINFFNISQKKKLSLIKATTHDIEWNGDK